MYLPVPGTMMLQAKHTTAAGKGRTGIAARIRE